MKSTKSLFLLLAIAAAWLSSCSSGPLNSDWESYRAEMLRYFPYQVKDTCVFENTDKDSSILFLPHDSYGSFPSSDIYISNCGPFEKCGPSEVYISALWHGTEDKNKSYVQMILSNWGGNKMEFHCSYSIWSRSDNEYYGIITATYPMDEVLSYLQDTLVLPFERYYFMEDGVRTHIDISSQGAYLRLVKGHGLTDFSLDGTTVWHQVKK